MIKYNYETEFSLENEDELIHWIEGVIAAEGRKLEEVSYIFCDDDYLLKLNVEFLKHDTLTDIISFDYSVGKSIQGDIFISVERVADNAKDFEVPMLTELHRVMVHGVLHYCGYTDKTGEEKKMMREKEDYYLSQLV